MQRSRLSSAIQSAIKPKAKAKGKRGLTAAGRKKLGELMKARWAARRKGVAK